MDEDSGEKLEWVGQSVIVELVSRLLLVDEQSRALVEPESGEVDRRPHETTSQLAAFAEASAGQTAVSVPDASAEP